MKKSVILTAFAVCFQFGMVFAQDDGTGATCPGFEWDEGEELEVASQAVKNMKLGWNLGNTLDSNSGDTQNMWIERWGDRTPASYETAWGQPKTTRALIHMIKEAGFKSVRVPVTWYPHMGTFTVKNEGNIGTWDKSTWTGTTVDSTWMARVKEVVDYVIEEGMYCILNVHHDTGDGSTAWIKADNATFEEQQARFESLWTQIATTFKSYDERLIFEGYNEMLDSYNSWCFASFATSNHYDATVANNAYAALKKFGQSFVRTVRKTGGNNLSRNLLLNTYAACSGGQNWNSHLQDPLSKMELPQDTLTQHLIIGVHCYPSFTTLTEAKQRTDAVLSDIATYLQPKAPVIIGEWGVGNSDVVSYKTNQELTCGFAHYFCERAKAKGIAPMYWMGLSDGESRSVPEFNEPLLKDAMIAGFNGEALAIERLERSLPGKTNKRIENHQLTIEANGARYNAAGVIVR